MFPGAREAFAEMGSKFRANYGKDKFPEEKLALVWDELKDLSPKQIRNICDAIMGEVPYPPTVAHFREKTAQFKAPRFNTSKALSEPDEDFQPADPGRVRAIVGGFMKGLG